MKIILLNRSKSIQRMTCCDKQLNQHSRNLRKWTSRQSSFIRTTWSQCTLVCRLVVGMLCECKTNVGNSSLYCWTVHSIEILIVILDYYVYKLFSLTASYSTKKLKLKIVKFVKLYYLWNCTIQNMQHSV